MADIMTFPKDIKEFIKDYSFKDRKEVYTNGSELIPVFRVEQALEHYKKELRAEVIDELKNKICMHFADWKYSEDDNCIKDIIELASDSVEEIADDMKVHGSSGKK